MFPIWDLGGSRWVQNSPMGCENHFPLADTLLEHVMFVKYVQPICFILSGNGFYKRRSLFYMYRSKCTTKKTVWYVRRDYVFRQKSHLLETRHQQNPRGGFVTFQVTLQLSGFIGDALMTTSY